MITQKSYSKISHLLNEINTSIQNIQANLLISKFYALISKTDQQISELPHLGYPSSKQREKQKQLEEYLDKAHQLFESFKTARSEQIKHFNQVECYMFEQSIRIFQEREPSFVKKVINKISDFFYQSPRKNDPPELKGAEDTSSSTGSDQNFPSKGSLVNLGSQLLTSDPSVDCSKSWQIILSFYQNHRLDEAHQCALKFQNHLYQTNKYTKLNSSQIQMIQTINFQYKLMTEFYDHFYDTGYDFDKQDKDIKLWYKIVNQKDVAIKVEAEVQMTIQNFLCIASEINLFEEYMPFTYETRQLKSISRNQKLGHSKVFIPLLTDRQTYFYAAAYDRLKTKGSIFFFSKTINQDLEYQKKYSFEVPKESKYVRLDYKYYILEYIPLTKTRGKINMVSSIDLKMDYLPVFIINKTARIFSFDYMKNYVRINKKFAGSKWDIAKEKKKQLYDYFKRKIEEHLQEKERQSSQKKEIHGQR